MTIKQDTDAPTLAAKNKGGRPRKHASTERRPTLTFRVRGDMHELLARSAKQSERSISEEIEAIIREHFDSIENAGSPGAEKLLGFLRTALKLFESTRGPIDIGKRSDFLTLKGFFSAMFDTLAPDDPDHPDTDESTRLLVDAIYEHSGKRVLKESPPKG